MQLTNTRFRPCLKVHTGGSVVLGYLYVELVIAGFHLGMPNLQVRLTRNGTPRVDFPSHPVTVKGKTERYDEYFTASKESRQALTDAIFALPDIEPVLAAGRVAKSLVPA